MARPGAGTVVAGVELSHPDRVLYPEQGVTKAELARYCARVADRMLPHVAGRPLSVVRCPSGRTGSCFYQKHLTEGFPAAVEGVEIRERSGGKATYLMVSDTAGLVSLVQLGVLEIHPWSARADRLERPDRMILDLDPGPGVAWSRVVDGARRLRSVLEELDLSSFVKTSGSKGLHVVVPLDRRSRWEEVRAVARAVAERLVDEAPDRFVATAAKDERGGRIFVDVLRNSRGATSVAPYSPRARAGAPVSAPLRWDELGRVDGAGAYTVANMGRRLGGLRSDPWEELSAVRQRITAAVRRRLRIEGAG